MAMWTSLRRHAAAAGLLLACWSASIASAQPTQEQIDKAAAGQPVTIVDLEGTEFRGRLSSLTPDSVTLAGKTSQTFRRDQILRLQTERKPLGIETGPCLLLANGDRLALRADTIQDDRLVGTWAEMPSRPALTVPLEIVRGVILRPPERADDRRSLMKELLDRREDADLVVLNKGDRITGEFTSLVEAGVNFRSAGKEFLIPRADVRAILFNASLIAAPRIDGRRDLLQLADGSRLSVRNARIHPPDTLAVEPVFGGPLELPLSAMSSLRMASGLVTPLSERPAAAYEFTPFLSRQWKLGLNRAVTGGPLVLRGVEYARGLGMHSRASVEYRLEGQYVRFLSTAGIDDSANGGGDVVFAVDVDGERVFTSSPQTGRSPPLKVGPIDLRGKKTLRLLVDFSRQADVLDYADWCDAVLIGKTQNVER